jgi:hypothetical protein
MMIDAHACLFASINNLSKHQVICGERKLKNGRASSQLTGVSQSFD